MEPRLGRMSHSSATGRRRGHIFPSRPVFVKRVTIGTLATGTNGPPLDLPLPDTGAEWLSGGRRVPHPPPAPVAGSPAVPAAGRLRLRVHGLSAVVRQPVIRRGGKALHPGPRRRCPASARELGFPGARADIEGA